MQKDIERITILIDAQTKQRLVKAAIFEDRTVSQVIRGLVKSHLQQVEKKSSMLETDLTQPCSTNSRHY
ncbi:hypothetical protein F7R12_29265 [Pseudomonas tolaasii]|nr:hypothetical protein F7R12_29265 [Pseudomonas tolaasii]